MITCPQCNTQQESGKFCGSCGADLSPQASDFAQPSAKPEVAAAASAQSQPVYTNENLNKAKEGVSKYWNFALDVLKRPSAALTGNETHFTNGLITIAVYVVAFSLSLYFLANKLFKTMMGGFGSAFGEGMGAKSLPFFDIASPIFMFVLLFIAGAMLSSFAAIKMMSEPLSFKGIIGQFGSIIIPFAAMNVIAIIFGLAGSIQLTLLLTGLSLLFTTFIMPAIVVYDFSLKIGKPVNRVYWSVGASALSMLIAYLVVRTSVLSFIEDMEQIMNIF
ncbi:zinc ribbon domain-containing protein [Pseudalkalibacillus caeni]|uniref:Zinc ribbon domain-containing protein n=1 Tax=Exobacillus caeni TaxID=2574798 RepID=A0A5R9F502_9BACL|nr:zinc ribbon domain-containing protein [Pseudalkalibacillus caeni]TLS38597.1 zinc ribbon domain-containing protein [Pseudalkalibacillus caeni]